MVPAMFRHLNWIVCCHILQIGDNLRITSKEVSNNSYRQRNIICHEFVNDLSLSFPKPKILNFILLLILIL